MVGQDLGVSVTNEAEWLVGSLVCSLLRVLSHEQQVLTTLNGQGNTEAEMY